MENNGISLLVTVVIIMILLLILRRDSQKLAITQDVTEIANKSNTRIYVASHVSDRKNPGAKILLILHSLYCRKCDSTNVLVDLSDDGRMLIIKCRECSYSTRIKMDDLLL